MEFRSRPTYVIVHFKRASFVVSLHGALAASLHGLVGELLGLLSPRRPQSDADADNHDDTGQARCVHPDRRGDGACVRTVARWGHAIVWRSGAALASGSLGAESSDLNVCVRAPAAKGPSDRATTDEQRTENEGGRSRDGVPRSSRHGARRRLFALGGRLPRDVAGLGGDDHRAPTRSQTERERDAQAGRTGGGHTRTAIQADQRRGRGDPAVSSTLRSSLVSYGWTPKLRTSHASMAIEAAVKSSGDTWWGTHEGIPSTGWRGVSSRALRWSSSRDSNRWNGKIDFERSSAQFESFVLLLTRCVRISLCTDPAL
jgi:hypothetical protein